MKVAKSRAPLGKDDTWRPVFQAECDEAQRLARLRLDRRDVAQLYSHLRQASPLPSWELARAAQPLVESEIAKVDWSQIAGANLIVLVERYFALATARDRFLPDVYAKALSTPYRWTLLLQVLAIHAGRDGQRPEDAVISALVTTAAGPRAMGEIDHRLRRGHCGVYAALWLLLARWGDLYGGTVDEAEISDTTTTLRKMAWRHVARSARHIPFQEATSAVATVVLSQWGTEHPLEVFARALDGQLNIAPRKIGNSVTKGDNRDHEPLAPDGRMSLDDPDTTLDERTIRVEFRHDDRFDQALETAVAAKDFFRALSDTDRETVDAILRAGQQVEDWEDRYLHADQPLPSRRPSVRTFAAQRLNISPQAIGKRLAKIRRDSNLA